MARKAALFVLMLVLVTVCEGGNAPFVVCNMTYDGLMSCKPAITKGSTQEPTKECCQAIKGADLKCLCGYKNDPILVQLGIDPALAFALPGKCKVSLPPNC
ncbi:putative lipid-transfer protein DIR1 [Tripterygium wilfordii]|uniref:Putative lipid-transfer protein DIR1 n=1 Tax=Tripterygium wilfordii TaxID=458696 RepID=A0A7J7DJ57_TRIWF|nr:putative lipid-transfer protein DIR1 [Tripterygium wilfordii]